MPTSAAFCVEPIIGNAKSLSGRRGGLGPRVARELLAESLILAVLGGIAGLAIAGVLLQLLLRQLTALPFALPHLQSVTLDERALEFSAVLCAALACITCLAPVVFASRTDVQSVLRGARRYGKAIHAALFRADSSEAAFAFLLLIGSGLMIRSLIRLQSADTGFHADTC